MTAFITNATIKQINATVIDNYTNAFNAAEPQSTEITTVRPVSSQIVAIAAPAGLKDLEEWTGMNEVQRLSLNVKTYTNLPYHVQYAVNKYDLKDSAYATGKMFELAEMGNVAKLHNDRLAAQALEGGYASDRTLWTTAGTPIAATQHFFDGDLISTHNEGGLSQTNSVSGSAGFTKELLAEACDLMRGFRGNNNKSLAMKPQYLVCSSEMRSAADTMLNLTYGTVSSTTTLENVIKISYQGIKIIELDDLKNSRAMWLLGGNKRVSVKPIIITDFQAPQIIPVINPDYANVYNDKEFIWTIERNTGYAVPLWQSVVRITA